VGLKVLSVADVSVKGRAGTRWDRNHDETTWCHVLRGIAEERGRFIQVLQNLCADGNGRSTLDRRVEHRGWTRISQDELDWELCCFGRSGRSLNSLALYSMPLTRASMKGLGSIAPTLLGASDVQDVVAESRVTKVIQN